MRRKEGKKLVPEPMTEVWMTLMECLLPQPPLEQQQAVH